MSNTNLAMFYNSKDGDREYDADDMTDWLKPFFTTGVFNGELQVTSNDDMTVTVAVGYVNVAGKTKHFVSTQKFDLETASGTLNRYDTVIIRRNDTDRDITVMVQTGSYAASPQVPELVRSGAYYDLMLAKIYVAAGSIKITQENITDTRADASLCGWVVSTVNEVDFSQLTAQFESYFTNYQTKITNQYKGFLDYIQNLEDQGSASYAQLLKEFTDYTAQQQTTFSTWFQSMKDQLSKDAAGNLQLEIDALSAKIGNAITDLSTKVLFVDKSKDTATKKINITNTTTGTVTQVTYAAGVKTYLTEPGTYTVVSATDGYYTSPKAFTLDNTKTTETLSFNILSENGVAFVGGYIGAYVAKSATA